MTGAEFEAPNRYIITEKHGAFPARDHHSRQFRISPGDKSPVGLRFFRRFPSNFENCEDIPENIDLLRRRSREPETRHFVANIPQKLAR